MSKFTFAPSGSLKIGTLLVNRTRSNPPIYEVVTSVDGNDATAFCTTDVKEAKKKKVELTMKGTIDFVQPKSPPFFDVLTGKERMFPGK